MNKAIIVYGDLTKGYTFVGPFESAVQAVEYASETKDTGYSVVTLDEPAFIPEEDTAQMSLF